MQTWPHVPVLECDHESVYRSFFLEAGRIGASKEISRVGIVGDGGGIGAEGGRGEDVGLTQANALQGKP